MAVAQRFIAAVPAPRSPAVGDRVAERSADGVGPLRLSDPRRIRRYTLTGRLGRGGEAIVYRARSRRTGSVAVKVLRPDAAMPTSLRQAKEREVSLRQEFDLARRVDPRFVMAPIESGTSSVGSYLVSTYRAGYRPLSSRVRPGTRTLWQTAYSSALAIAAIHACGIIHCDVKPANVLAMGDDVRLIDFGIARFVDDQPDAVDVVHCSRGWSAPEQLCVGRLTPAVDVFGWGCVMGYLAAGAPPFASDSLEAWVLRVRSTEPDLSGLPGGLEELVRFALSRDPARRPSAAYLAAACRGGLCALPVAA